MVSIDPKLVQDYLDQPESFVKHLDLPKGKKVRHLITYAESEEGCSLKAAHKLLLAELDPFPSSQISYAYKEKYSTKDAVWAHRGSLIFIKLDISSFFESITLSALERRDDPRIKKMFPEGISCCFYQNHLPLGFVTSPKISDIYMQPFDDKMEDYVKKHKNLRISRYSDDILISSKENDFQELYAFEEYLSSTLSEIGLALNYDKRKVFDLSGDKPKHSAVHFLGLNLVRGDPYYISVSKGMILKAIDLARKRNALSEKIKEERIELQILKKVDAPDATIKEKRDAISRLRSKIRGLAMNLNGLVSYIRHNSARSYERFERKYKNVFGKPYRK